MSTPPPIAVGDVIGDAYVVERFLGGGGMGSIFVCRDTTLDRRVAVKVLHREIGGSSEADMRFQTEARVMSRVVHPNVVAIYAFGRHADAWYLAMELVEGEDLDEVLRREGKLSLEDAVSLTRQIASGLAEAHGHGIIHRDIKPANVLLRRLASGVLLAKVVDFGIARVFGAPEPDQDASQDTQMLGTPAYMPPEQIQAQSVDGRADLYSLAVLCFQMLSGSLPVYRQSAQGILLAHLLDEPGPLVVPGVRKSTAQAMQKVIHRALAKKVEGRQDDVLSFAAELEEASGLALRTGRISVVPCPACRHACRGGGGFCESCGSAVPMVRCPACNARRHGERYFCAECGTSLLGTARRGVAEQEDGGQGTEAVGAAGQVTSAVLVARLGGAVGAPGAVVAAEFARSFASAVEREGGRPLALLGHECLAVFGLGGMREGEVEAAVDTALALPRLLDRLRGEQEHLTMAVGIALGRLATSGLGFAWGTALAGGEVVEAARRAAAAASDGGVVITDIVRREVERVFETRPQGVGQHRVLRHTRASTSLSSRGMRGGRGPLVGRSADLKALMEGAATVRRDRRLYTVAIAGEAGSGKSRVAGAFLSELQRSGDGWQVDVARCSPIGFPVPFEPFVDILRSRTGAHEASDRGAIAGRLAALLGGGEPGDQRIANRAEALGRLMGLEANQTLRLEAARPADEVEQAGAFEAYVAYLRGAAVASPLVMVLEDLQWARAQTLELLDHILRSCADLPLLIVKLLRRERSDEVLKALALPEGRSITRTLVPFTASGTARMLSALTEGANVPSSLAVRVHEFASGLPGRVEEAFDALQEEGVFRLVEGSWQVAAESAVSAALDRSLSEVVLQRIGRLPPAERSLLRALASAGSYAPLGLLAAMLERDITAAELDRVCQNGHVVELRARHFKGEREFAIRQRQVADILADAVPTAHKRDLHRRAARWLMDWKGPRPPGFGATLAHHFLVAGDDRRAAEFLVRVAQESMRAFATRDAREAFAAAVEVAREAARKPEEAVAVQPTLIEALLGLAEVGAHIGEVDESLAAADEVLGHARAAEDGVVRARALLVQGELRTRAGDYDGAIDAYGHAATIGASDARGVGLAAIATGRKAMVLFRAGLRDEAGAFARAGLDHYVDAVPTADLQRGLGRLHVVLGHLASIGGRFDVARSHFEAARDRSERGGDRIGVNVALLSLGNAAYRSGDLDGAQNVYRRAADACHQIDYLQGVAVARTNLGNVLLDKKEPGAALVELLPAEQAMRRSRSLDMLPETLRLIAICRLETGGFTAALTKAGEAKELALRLGNEAMAKAAADVLEEAEVRAGDPDATTTRIEAIDVPPR